MAKRRKRKFSALAEGPTVEEGHRFNRTRAQHESNQHQGDVSNSTVNQPRIGHQEINIYAVAEPVAEGRSVLNWGLVRTTQKTRMVDAPRNVLFTGRDAVLEQIHKYIKPRPKEIDSYLRSCVLLGLGGMGKTQIAIEYIYRHQYAYDKMFWVQAESGSELAETYGAIALAVGDKVQREWADNRQKIKHAKDWLSCTDASWLLIFDNVSDMRSIEQYIPASDTGSIIITTQLRNVELAGSKCFSIEGLSGSDGSRLLRLTIDPTSPDAPQKDVDSLTYTISEDVGGLPLAIAQIGGYIKRAQISYKEFCRIYKKKRESWINNRAVAASAYDKTLQTVFDIALEPLNQDARDLIDCLAFLHPEDIWEDIFIKDQEGSSTSHTDDHDSKFMESRFDLSERCLINRFPSETVSTSNLSMHRSLREALLFKLDADETRCGEIFLRAFKLIRAVTPRQSPLSSLTLEWARFEKYMPHILSLCSAYEDTQRSHSKLNVGLAVAELVSDIGNYMWERGLINDAFRILGIGERICAQVLDSHDPNPIRTQILYVRASFELMHGSVLRLEGLHHKQQILEFREKRFASSTPENLKVDELQLSTALNNLGCAYIQCEDYEQAENFLNDALQRKLKWGDEKTLASGIAEQYKNLALVAISKGEISEALNLSEKAVSIITAGAGPRQKKTLFHRLIRASIIFNSGDVARSLEENIDILNIKKEILDESDNELLDSYYAVGMMQHLQNDLSGAEHNLRQSLGHRDQYFETSIARALYRLSRIVKDLHRYDEAAAILREAHSLRDKLLQPTSGNHSPGVSLDEKDEAVIYDQMVSCWAGRYGGKQNVAWQKKNAVSE